MNSTGSTVDSKVVEMSFDNSNFEPNAEKSISTLDKLKKALNFTDSTDGLDDINDSLKNINVGSLTTGVTSLRHAFDSLADTVGFAAVVRYTNQALDAVERLAKSMTVDNIAAGWSKYGEKTTSVATLVAQGYELEKVNEQLERLNWFTDETSYNFTDMVSNIAKFTATGQDLETSVTAMEGIANWAALSGQNATTASHAMYQLSQAMGAGLIRKEDYKSIQNVSMDTDEFRQRALDAAVALGTLKKTGEDAYQSLVAESKKGKEEFSKSQFAESLTQGQWFNKDVMMKVFNDYSAAVDQIYEYAEEKGLTASEAMAEAGDQFDAFGVKAFKAAQEARTWGDVVDSVKDASSTAFMNMFEIIFGDYEEATALWTGMANGLYDALVEPINEFNEILGEAFGVADKVVDLKQWEDLGLTETQATGLAKALKDVAEANGVAFEDDSLESFLATLNDGWLKADAFKDVLEGFGKGKGALEDSGKSLEEFHEAAMKVIKGGTEGYSSNMEERFRQLTEEGFDPQQVQDYVNELHKLASGTWNITDAIIAEADANQNLVGSLEAKSDEELLALGYTQEQIDSLRELQQVAEETGTPLEELINGEAGPSGREQMLESMKDLLAGLQNIIRGVQLAFEMIFPPATADTLTSFITGFRNLTKSFRQFTGKNIGRIKNIFLGVFSAIDLVIRVIKTFVGGSLKLLKQGIENLGLLRFLETIGLLVKRFRDWVVENEIIEKTFNKISTAITTAVSTVKGWIDTILQIPEVQAVVEKFKNAFTMLFNNLPATIESVKKAFSDFFTRIKTYFKALSNGSISFGDFFKGILSSFKLLGQDLGDIDVFKAFGDAFGSLKDLISEKLSAAGDAIWDWLQGIRERLGDSTAGQILGWILDKFEEIKEKISSILSGDGITDGEDGGGLFDKIKEKLSIGGIIGLIGDFISAAINLISKIPFGKILKLAPVAIAIAGFIKIVKPLAGLFISAKEGINNIGGFFKSIQENGLINTLKGKGGEDATSKFERITAAVKSLAIAIAILVASVTALSMIETSDLAKALIALGIIAGIIVGVTALLALIDKKLGTRTLMGKSNKNSSGLGIAVSIFILAMALSKLSKIEPDRLRQAEEAIVVIAAILVALMFVSKLSGKHLKGNSKFGTLIGIAAAMYVMALAFEKLGKIKPERLRQAEEAMVIIAGVLIALMLVSRISAKGLKGNTKFTSLVGILAAMYVMALTMSKLAEIDPSRLRQAEEAMAVIALILAGLMLVSKLTGKNLGDGSKMLSMVGLAAAIYILAMALEKVASIEPDRLEKAQEAILLLGVLFAALLIIDKLASSLGDGSSFLTLIGMAGAVFILAGSLALLSTVDPAKLQNATLCLSIMVGVFAILMVISKFTGSVSPTLLVLVGIIAILGIVLAGLSLLPTDKVLPTALALTAVILALSALLVAISAMGMLSGGVDAGLIALAKIIGFIAVFGVVAGLLGALIEKFPQLQTFVDTGIDLLIQISEGIGRIIGAFVGGLASEMSESLPTVAENLKTFLEKMQEATALGTFDFAPLAEAIAAIALIDFAGLFGSIASLVNEMTEGKSNTQVFADDLSALATSFAQYQTTMDEVDGIEINMDPLLDALGAIAAISLFEFFNTITNLVSLFTSKQTAVETFASDLETLAGSFATYQTTMDSVDDITIDTSGLTEISDAMKDLSLTGLVSALGTLLTEDDKTAVETFSSDLETLAGAIQTWDEKMTEVGEITIDSEGIQAVIDAMDEIPKQDLFDAIGAFFGIEDTSFDDFKENAGKLGEAIQSFSDSLGDIDESKLTTAASAAKMIGDLGVSLGKIDLKSGFFSGDTDFGRFGAALEPFGTALNTFAGTITNADKVSEVAEAAKNIAQAGQKMALIDFTTGDLMDESKVTAFSEHVGILVEALEKASDAGNSATDGVESFTASVGKLAKLELGDDEKSKDAGKSMGDAYAEGMQNASGSMSDAMNDAVSGAADAVSGATGSFQDAGLSAMTAMAIGMLQAVETVKLAATTVASGGVEAIRESRESFKGAGSYVGFGFSSGINSTRSDVVMTANRIAQAAVDEIKRTIKSASPSKVTMRLGEYFGQGFVNGISEYNYKSGVAGNKLANSARQGLERGISAISNMISDELDTSPVIRPVLDLSEIQNGVGTIDTMLNTGPSVALTGNIGGISASLNNRLNPNAELLSALDSLKNTLGTGGGDTYVIDGITYDDGSNITSAVQSLVRAARMERRA